jgi:AcrR family transcriptional regulator
MPAAARGEPAPRLRLSRDRVLHAAVGLADRHGIAALTMRRLAEDLGHEAMSLYYHVANKDDLLDGVVDVVAREILEAADAVAPWPPTDPHIPAAGLAWKDAVRRRILAARAVLLRHPWAPQVFETRTAMSPAVVLHHDRLVGLMRGGGLSYDVVHHALHVLGSRALGFTQELFDPGDAGGDDPSAMLDGFADQVPNLAGMLREVAHTDPDSTLGWCDDQTEFEFGLDLILDGLDRLR